MQVKAAVLRTQGAPFVVEDIELPEPKADQVLVEIAGTGFCHTDVLPRMPQFASSLPVIAGHEASGVVIAAGPAASVAVGTPVVLTFDSCGRCASCLSGHPAYCVHFRELNLGGAGSGDSPAARDIHGAPVGSRWFGQSSFASHAIAGPRNVVPVSDDLPLELLGPLGCGIQTGAGSILVALGVQAGDSVAIYGVGAVGLAAVMAARLAGASSIVAVDLDESRLERAQHFGATHIVRGDEEDLGRRVAEAAGAGISHALDTTAAPEVISAAIDSVRPTGSLGLVGVGSRDVTLGRAALTMGKTIMGILEGDVVPQLFIPRLIDLWQKGLFPFDELIATYPLDDINRAEQDAASGATVKPVLLPRRARRTSGAAQNEANSTAGTKL